MKKELNILPGGVVDELDVIVATQLSQRTLRRLRQKGTLHYSKIGKRIFYPIADIERLMNGTLETQYWRAADLILLTANPAN